jgi:hypothetical protein
MKCVVARSALNEAAKTLQEMLQEQRVDRERSYADVALVATTVRRGTTTVDGGMEAGVGVFASSVGHFARRRRGERDRTCLPEMQEDDQTTDDHRVVPAVL